MIVVDTSVLIDWFRGGDSKGSRYLKGVEYTDDIKICDLVLMEILQGARDDLHSARIQKTLARFGSANVLDDSIAVRAAENFRRLRALGITIRKTNDLIIGTWCIENRVPLLHSDRDFAPMAEHLGLIEY
jgi:predicted nucleic acid-binding protein